MVTLLNIIVFGLQGRFGAITAKRVEKPSLLLTKPLQKAVSTAEPRGPIIKSMCAISAIVPEGSLSLTSDSPTITLLIIAIIILLFSFFNLSTNYRQIVCLISSLVYRRQRQHPCHYLQLNYFSRKYSSHGKIRCGPRVDPISLEMAIYL